MPIFNHRSRCTRTPNPGPPRVVRVPLPPVDCQPWCRAHDGHPDHFFRDDQACYSPDNPDPVVADDVRVGVYAHNHPDRGVTVALYFEALGERPAGLDQHLTGAQARRYAAQILATCDLIETQGGSVARECIDCEVTFEWDSSPDDDRCAGCALRPAGGVR